MKPVTEILLSAAFVLTPKENWTHCAYARSDIRRLERDEAGLPQARSWCVVAAVDQAAKGRYEADAALRILAIAAAGVPWISLERFNNETNHRSLLRALYKAAELAESM